MVIAEVIDSPVFNETGLDLGLLILRVVVGLTIAAHGYNHIFRAARSRAPPGGSPLGMKPGILHAWLASITELAAGLLLALGLLTPLGAAGGPHHGRRLRHQPPHERLLHLPPR